MKRIIAIIWLLSSLGVLAQTARHARLQGTVKDFPGGQVICFSGQQSDSLSVNADGTFDWQLDVEEPREVFISFMGNRSSFFLYAEPGMNAELDISFRKGMDFAGNEADIAVVDYRGDNADCFCFMREYQEWPYVQWPVSRLDSLSFTDYRVRINEETDRMKAALMHCGSRSFCTSKTAWVDARCREALFRYALATPRPDAAFEMWMETIDRNDRSHMSDAAGYLKWYLGRYPAPEGKSKGIWYLETLKKVFGNQQIIDYFADSYIKDYLRQPPPDMKEALETYLQVSANGEAHQKAQAVYDRFSRLMPGTQAPEIEMTDADGKIRHLSDFLGRAVYIDVWATWCGPCCLEIPYVEKLAEHYKDNRKIEFLSISLDRDRNAWLKKLAADRPQWKQFICQGKQKAALNERYDIQGIPRFLFIDKKGRIISLMAPRPSSEEIIEYIDRKIN